MVVQKEVCFVQKSEKCMRLLIDDGDKQSRIYWETHAAHINIPHLIDTILATGRLLEQVRFYYVDQHHNSSKLCTLAQ